MAYPMIYHDPAHGFMVCLRPSGAVSKAEAIPAVRGLKKRSVKNPQELKEKILIFEAGLDDAAVELVKNAIVTVLKRSIEGNVHAYFCAADEKEMRFAIFVRGRQEPVLPDDADGRVPPVAGGAPHAGLQGAGRFCGRQFEARPAAAGPVQIDLNSEG